MCCSNCGNNIANGEKFCSMCGTPVAKRKEVIKSKPMSAASKKFLMRMSVIFFGIMALTIIGTMIALGPQGPMDIIHGIISELRSPGKLPHTDPFKPVVKPAKPTTDQNSSSTTNVKLSKIVFELIDIDGVNISTVAEYLTLRTKELDLSPDKLGVIIVPRLTEEQIENLPRITIKQNNMTLGEVLAKICLACGLRYQIEKDFVVLSLK